MKFVRVTQTNSYGMPLTEFYERYPRAREFTGYPLVLFIELMWWADKESWPVTENVTSPEIRVEDFPVWMTNYGKQD